MSLSACPADDNGRAFVLRSLMSPLALSTCWNSYRHQDGYEMLKEIRQLGFPAVELGHGIRFSLWPGILKAWEEDLIKITTLHNFCPVPTSVVRPNPNCYEFSDSRPEVRTLAVRPARKRSARRRSLARAAWSFTSAARARGVTRKLERIYEKGGYLDRAYTEAKVKAVRKRKEASPSSGRG